MPDTLTGEQCAQARKLLGWDMRALRERSMVSLDAISRLERNEGRLQGRTLRDLRVAFEAAGIEFKNSTVRLLP